jgi:hypothetical protein
VNGVRGALSNSGTLTGAIAVDNDDGGVRQAPRRDRSVTRPVIVASS